MQFFGFRLSFWVTGVGFGVFGFGAFFWVKGLEFWASVGFFLRVKSEGFGLSDLGSFCGRRAGADKDAWGLA